MGQASRILMAHTVNGNGRRHLLEEHLRGVARLAESFAQPMGAAELGRAVGLWHDVGKAAPAFQEYLRRCEVSPEASGHGPDHKGAGSILALRRGLEPLALLIQGHHGGLCDLSAAKGWLRERCSDPETARVLDTLPSDIASLIDTAPAPPSERSRLEAEFFLRMLFSCLVDADYLDTEAHFDPDRAGARRSDNGGIRVLDDRLTLNQTVLQQGALATAVNVARAEIGQACTDNATMEPGLFRLAVPTGGGKTRAGMAFALRHAARHGLRRVIVAVPFTSITEQTANVYRQVFGSSVVLEHHSAMDLNRFVGAPPNVRLWARLATENWDASIVVTTTVQLFESLFAKAPSATRKLHRLAQAVIFIDEAQALPPHLIKPAVDALRLLCEEYGSTVILSTATQPAADAPELAWLNEARDIVPEPGRFFQRLKRVEWQVIQEIWDAARVAQEVAGLPQVLTIVNTRRAALNVLDRGDGWLHLSTLLCGAHRHDVLAEAKRRLTNGQPCRLVSTQVVEAGVDIDFPVVLREVAPFDSVVQAGGRCNREGRLDHGRVIVFSGTEHPPAGAYRTGTNITNALLADGNSDFDDPHTAARYFRDLYAHVDIDQDRVQEAQKRLAFEEVARRFRMIKDEGTPVVVPYDQTAAVLVEDLRRNRSEPNPGRARALLRRLQPYMVRLRQREIERAGASGWVTDELVPVWTGPYDAVRGVGAVLARKEEVE